MLRVYQYPKCSTCRKALRWLDDHGVPYEGIDITLSPPSADVLAAALATSHLPIARFFNTSGQAYRAGNYKERMLRMTEADALLALARDGKLIKRPLAIAQGVVLVGFDPAQYAAELSRFSAIR